MHGTTEVESVRWRSALLLGLYLFILSVFIANLEIQIEGPNGWAADLPTWRITNPHYTWVFGGRPITGYHVFLNLVLLTFFHFPLLFRKPTLRAEVKILYSFLVISVVWDFLWFAFNPHFGIWKYRPENIPWFKNWILGVPADYFVGLAITLVVWLVPSFLGREGALKRVLEWTISTGTLISLAVISAFVIAWVNG